MKKLNKLEINSEKLMKNEELVILRGGDATYKCYEFGWMPDGWCENLITYINTTSCDYALMICNEVYEGGCVEC